MKLLDRMKKLSKPTPQSPPDSKAVSKGLLFSVDPGLRGCGCCLIYRESGEVAHAWYTDGIEAKGRGPDVWAKMAEAVWRDVEKRVGLHVGVEEIVLEVPQVYYGQQNKGDANDLIDLAGVDGAIVGRGLGARHIYWYLPRAWKGTVPKPVHNKRVLSKLALSELVVIGKAVSNHNIIDAIGLGKFHWKQQKVRA